MDISTCVQWLSLNLSTQRRDVTANALAGRVGVPRAGCEAHGFHEGRSFSPMIMNP